MAKQKTTRQDLISKHQEFLKSVGYTGKGSEYKVSIPSYQTKTSLPPTSDKVTYVPNAPREKPSGAKNFTVAPAYNKGPSMLITEENIKDIGK